MKKFFIFLLVLIALLIAFCYFFPLELVVKKAVNKYGSPVTDTAINMNGFDLSLKNGSATIKQITVANPKNYKTPNAIELGNIHVKVDTDSLTKDTIIIKEIVVDKPVVTFEMMSLTQNNIADLIDNVNKYSASSATNEKTTEAKTEESSSSKKVIIIKIVISNGQVNGAMTAAPDVISASVPLPTVTMNNIGENTQGTSIGESIALILNKLLSTISTTVVSSNFANLHDAAKNAASSVTETAGNVVEGVTDTLKGLNPFGK